MPGTPTGASPSTAAAIPVVCLVLIDRGGAILATRRPKGKSLGGLWEFPGGKLESAESPGAALRREILEELHLDLTSLCCASGYSVSGDTFLPAAVPLPAVTHSYPFGTIRLLPFAVRCEERPELILAEHTAFCWVTIEEADALEWAPADLPVLEGLKKTYFK